MNKNLLIGFGVILAVVLGLPLLASVVRPSGSPASTAAPATAQTPEPTPPQVTPQPTPNRQQQQHRQQKNRGGGQGRGGGQRNMTAQDLVGTAWQVNTPEGQVQIQLQGGGNATASHPMLGTIPGKWQVQGNRVTATVSVMGQSHTISCQIRGNQLIYEGKPVRRLR